MSCISPWPAEAPTSDALAPDAGPLLDSEERLVLRRLILYGFLVRATLAVVLEWTSFSLRFAPDEETYASNGWLLSLYWSGDVLVRPWWLTSDQPLGYFYMNAVFFYLFGRTAIPLKLVNAMVGAVSCRYAYLIARELFGRAVARRTALLFVFFPSLVLWSALNIRDVWVILLIVFVSWHSLRVVRGGSVFALASVLGGACVLTLFRDYLFFVVAVPPVVAFLIGRRGHLERNFLLALAAALALLFLLQQGVVGERVHRRMSLEALSKARQDLAVGGSALQGDVDISTPGKALVYLPLGIAYFLFSPFPWQITSILKMFSVPEMILIYGLTPATIRGIHHALRAAFRESLQVLLLTGLLTVSYALGEGNIGTLYRHRAQVTVFYLMFASLGIEMKRSRAVAAQAA